MKIPDNTNFTIRIGKNKARITNNGGYKIGSNDNRVSKNEINNNKINKKKNYQKIFKFKKMVRPNFFDFLTFEAR